LQLTYSFNETSESKYQAYGLDTQIWWESDNVYVFFDVVATVTNDGSAWIYFWDVNLPGEMTTLVYTKMEYHRQLKYHIKLARDLS